MIYFINTICDNYFNSHEEIILGIYLDDLFCGILELYHYDKSNKEVSIGYRIDEKYWHQGIMKEVLSLLIDYLFKCTDIIKINASSMVNNINSNILLEKSGFHIVSKDILESWGFREKVYVNKWSLDKR